MVWSWIQRKILKYEWCNIHWGWFHKHFVDLSLGSYLISRKILDIILPMYLLRIWFHEKNRENELQDWFQSWIHKWFLKLCYPSYHEFDFTKKIKLRDWFQNWFHEKNRESFSPYFLLRIWFHEKIVKSSYGTDFKVDFTKKIVKFFTLLLAHNLISR